MCTAQHVSTADIRQACTCVQCQSFAAGSLVPLSGGTFFCACPARDKQLLAKSFLFRSVPAKKLLQPIPLILGHPGELNAITELWVAGNDHSF